MVKRNHFSQKFERKNTGELINLIEDDKFEEKAKIAAIWELERRGESNEKYTQFVNFMVSRQEQINSKEESSKRYRTVWQRILAFIIDSFVIWGVERLTNYLLISDISLIVILGKFIYSFVPFIYSIGMHGKYGQTLGKMAFDIKVIDVHEKRNITFKQAFIRDSIPLVLVVILLIYSLIINQLGVNFVSGFAIFIPMLILHYAYLIWTILEIVTMIFDEKSRSINDSIAKTVVIRTNKNIRQ